MEDAKLQIINIFKLNVLGKIYNKNNDKKNHNGSEGHWLETQMNITHNGKNAPDIFGYEMKCKTQSYISFGDWCPDIDEYGNLLKIKWWHNDQSKLQFMKKYGNINDDKNRWSWAVKVKYKEYNKRGQKFIIDDCGIFVIYNNKYDDYYDKRDIFIDTKGKDIKVIGWSHNMMKNRVNNKFGINGYFRPIKNKNVYIGLQFGEPIYYEEFLENVKNDNIYLDPGTHIGNNRPYMQWRSLNSWFTNREKNKLENTYIMEKEINITHNKITVVDLFCGCGGLTTGLVDAGLDVLAGIDKWDIAIDTYNANQHHIGYTKDLTKFTPEKFKKMTTIKSFDLLVGGPPCQGYSNAGKRDQNDPRNSLFMEYVKYLNYFRPKAFIMENVVGILSMKTAKGEYVKDIIMKELTVNYDCKYFKLSAADFEVPQNRKRIIFIGFLKELKINITEPIAVNPNKHIAVKTILEKKKDVPKSYFLSKKAIIGINKKKEIMKEKCYGFGAQFLNPDKPSFTIPARYYKDGYDALVYYDDDDIRRLTNNELAKIQSFPLHYYFEGNNKEIIMQIGNAVACKFAYHLGLYIKNKLNNIKN
jgi:DNA-cytosine methyltransferase